MCSSCGLAQLVSDPANTEEPRALEPAALAVQAASAVALIAGDGWLDGRATVAEFESPHGGSWLGHMAVRGPRSVGDGQQADVVLDCFGMMHAPDQRAALAERTTRVAPGGVLLLQFHSLGTILRLGQWTSLRHGHYAYYSTSALELMLREYGFALHRAWTFDLYGGTVLLAATREPAGRAHRTVRDLLDEERRTGAADPDSVSLLQYRVQRHSRAVHDWLRLRRDAGADVVGYGAASRAVALLLHAGIDRGLLPGIVDASPAKEGRRMPDTDIPILGTSRLRSDPPDAVLLMLPDLMDEVRAAFPEVERSGGQWVNVETIGAR